MFRFAAPITMNDASTALAAVDRAIDAGESVVSLAALAHSDSAAVAVLIAATRHAQAAGRRLTWSDVPQTVRSLAHLYGVEELIGGVEPATTASAAS